MDDLGTYLEHDGRPAVRFERTYPDSVDRVWAAITEPDELKRWFPSTVRYEPRVGGRIDFTGDPYAEDSSGTVLAFEPPRRFSVTWYTDELHFTLEPAGDSGCRLILINVLDDRAAAARNAGGWYMCLAELAKALEGRASGGPHGDDTEAWQPIYDAHVAAGLPSGAPVPEPSEG